MFIRKKQKQYDVIYADPPWQYRVWSNKKGAKLLKAIIRHKAMNF